MEAWSGGWGFDSEVESTLENAIAPYLIHNERTSPYPFQSSGVCPESPRTAYELLTLELSCFIESYHFKHKKKPSSQSLQLEACRIILASEVLTGDFLGLHCSWFRDLITSNEAVLQKARLAPVRTPAEGRLRSLEIRGKTTLFESCPLEEEMRNAIKSCQLSDPNLLQASYLQTKALEIIGGLCRNSPKAPFDEVSGWLLGLIFGSTNWLNGLIHRYGLQLQPEAPRPVPTPADITMISEASFSKLDVAQLQMNGFPFNNNPLTNWDQILLASNHPFAAEAQETLAVDLPIGTQRNPGLQPDCNTENTLGHLAPSHMQLVEKSDAVDANQRPSWLQNGNYILNDPNFHQWLGRELCRWATATTSSKNSDSHVPSDEEIQRQARLLLYGDDDPWNQTAVDHPEWLARFKRDLAVFRQDHAELPLSRPVD